MSINPRIRYHLRKLKIARNSKDPKHVMPCFSGNDQIILDVGCGICQTFAASSLENSKLLVGIDIDIDIDFESLLYGQGQFDYIHFINGSGDCLPFKSNPFDFIVSRVSLPYINIPKSLMEINRVLKKDGRIWFTLHPFSMILKQLKSSLLDFRIKQVISHIYVIANGIVLHFLGRLFIPPVYNKYKSRYESFQTELGITKALKNAGFRNITIHRKRHFTVTAEI